MKKLFSILFIVATCLTVFAQPTDSYKTLADKAFINKDYYEAAFYYKKLAGGLSLIPQVEVPYHASKKNDKKAKPADRAYVSFRLAESYRLYENYIEAEGWYYNVLNENFEAQYPLDRLWYGVCLRANQRFDESIKQLQQFLTAFKGDSKYADIAHKEIANCRFAKEQYQYPVLINVAKVKGDWNSDGSDYAVIKRDDNFWFTSSRFIKNDKKHLNRIYAVSKNSTDKPVIINFKSDEKKTELEYGTPSLNATGNKMYLTRWYREGSKTIHAIYYSMLQDGTWSMPEKLNINVNSDGFNSIQPFVTSDGKRLFFTSNKPGGQGGNDIWVSDLDKDGNPVNSINLGSIINTPLDEEAAYYDINEKHLIYSSKGFIGLGGFDFFESYGDMGQWCKPLNMGYPMNSAKDDLYYFPDGNNSNKFYISSDRESDCCLNLFEAYDKRHILSGLVTDCDTHKALAGVKVSFIDSLTKQSIRQLTSDKSGRYSFSITTKRPYNLLFEKVGYFAKSAPMPVYGKMSNDTLYNPEICLQAFVVNKPIVIKNVLYDYNKATLRPESKLVLDGVVTIMVDNPKVKIELGSHTDSIGSMNYNFKLSQARAQACVDYIISKGVSDTRIFAKGYGKSRPIAPNSLPNGKDNPDGRQLNRRTEFTVLKTE